MKINGKELGLAYTVGAHCEWDSYIVKNQQTAVSEAQIERIMIMHRAWCRANKVPDAQKVTRDEILSQPNRIFDEMVNLAEATAKADSEVTIEAESKNARSTEATG